MENKTVEGAELHVVELADFVKDHKCCSSYCGDCTYFNPRKTSFGKCWCGYYKSYSRKSEDLACSHFVRG